MVVGSFPSSQSSHRSSSNSWLGSEVYLVPGPSLGTSVESWGGAILDANKWHRDWPGPRSLDLICDLSIWSLIIIGQGDLNKIALFSIAKLENLRPKLLFFWIDTIIWIGINVGIVTTRQIFAFSVAMEKYAFDPTIRRLHIIMKPLHKRRTKPQFTIEVA